ncbi:hypothetical protein HDU98_010930 [Podochytrium sp. JEL0797]|nr:hypothetical protein HDU98_010930 [Podochytrium sp. JEL0797]
MKFASALALLSTVVNAQICTLATFQCSGQLLQECTYSSATSNSLGWVTTATCGSGTVCSSLGFCAAGALPSAAPVPTSAPAPVVSSNAPVATTTAGGSTGSNVPTTSGGSFISIIQPLTNSSFQVGQSMQITWSVGGTASSEFEAAPLTFTIDNASNPNNVVTAPNGALTFTKQPVVGDLMATVNVPNVAAGIAYTVKATYKDTNKNVNWYSPIFRVTGGSGPAPGASTTAGGPAGTSAAPVSTRPASTTTGAGSKVEGTLMMAALGVCLAAL